MRRRTRAALLLVALATFASAGQQPSEDEPYPLTIEVGATVAICYLGVINCPAGAPICDDPSVAIASYNETHGIVFEGVKAGVTLCSVSSAAGFGHRRLFRVTVTP
jgi:hypothetical protein